MGVSVMIGQLGSGLFGTCLGDVTSVLATPTGQPNIQILYNATQSLPAATALASITDRCGGFQLHQRGNVLATTIRLCP